ncbi:MAG: terminase family protein [Bryobacteraceae bacterium]
MATGPQVTNLPHKVSDWVRERLGFEPDALQSRVLDTEARRGILNCTRQWGKSTVTAAKAVRQAWQERGSLTIVVNPTSRQSGEFVRKAAGFARRLGIKPKGDGDNEISLVFPNGSRIVGLPGTEATVRGFSAVSLLLVDEASRVRDEAYLAVRPMLAVSGGKLWLMSTPCGKRGFFWEAWEHGGTEWERVKATAAECPRISEGFLREERRAMGDRWFRQEYCCEFSDAVGGVFDGDLVERAMSDEFEELKL